MPGIFAWLDGIIGVQSAIGGGGGGIRWLLRDEFTTDRAAGAVNGTAAEPGPGGNRKEGTPANNSIVSGQLVSVSGNGLGSYHLYDALPITREAGRLLIAKVTANKDPSCGFVSSTTPTLFSDLKTNIAANTVTLQVSTYEGGSINLGPVTSGQTYILATLLRASGAFFFIKGGTEYTKWTFLSIQSTGNTATLYVELLNFTGGVANNWDYIRVPVAKWLPTPLLSDGFGSAFGTSDGLGHAEGVAGGIGAGGSGVVLSNAGSTWSVSAGKAINTPTPGAELLTNGDFSAWTADNPDGWTLNVAEDANNYVTEVSGAARIVCDNTKAVGIYQSHGASTGAWIRFQLTVTAAVSGSINVSISNWTSGVISFSTIGAKVLTGRITSSGNCVIYRAAACDITFDDAAFLPLTLSELLTLSNLACADVYAGVAITKSSTYVQAGLALNWDSATSPANGLIVYLGGGNILVDKCVAGVWSNVSSTAYTYSAGARLVCTMNAGALRTYYNGALITTATIVDAGILAGTMSGLFSTDSSSTMDDLTIYATGTSGEHSALDAWSA